MSRLNDSGVNGTDSDFMRGGAVEMKVIGYARFCLRVSETDRFQPGMPLRNDARLFENLAFEPVKLRTLRSQCGIRAGNI